jgi:hypothetical protein
LARGVDVPIRDEAGMDKTYTQLNIPHILVRLRVIYRTIRPVPGVICHFGLRKPET